MSENWSGPIEKIDDYRWRIPRSYRRDMRVDAIVYATEKLLKQICSDQALEQLANVATMPGIVGNALVMPDAHWGYGFPIGGVAAFDTKDGVISPGGVGYDINCGVRLLRSSLMENEVRERIGSLTDQIFRDVPAGVGGKGPLQLTPSEVEEVAAMGARWMVRKGYGTRADIEHMEEQGCLANADPNHVGHRAVERGKNQLGTLGAGNHFLEIQIVDEIYNPAIAQSFGFLEIGQAAVMVHCGSRGFGYQICEDALRQMERALAKYHIELPDRQLACVPLGTTEADDYLDNMRCAANFAWANRQLIIHRTREGFQRVFQKSAESLGLDLVYDVCHNIAKFEEYEIDGQKRTVVVHRKGATRAFPPHHQEIPSTYRESGQPVVIPGDMGTCSYLLAGTERAMKETFGTCCHGAGRQLSRRQALKQTQGRDLVEELKSRGITVRAQSKKTLGEEAWYAYKNVSDVVDACHGAGIARKVLRLRPIGVIKG